jgi:hypothetical protein
MTTMTRWTIGAVTFGLFLGACGYSEEEMSAKQREINALQAEVHAMRLATMPPVYGYAPGKAGAGVARVTASQQDTKSP